MSLIFPYRLFSIGRPLVSLNGRSERPRPVILVSMTGPLGTQAEYSLLDTGADVTVFPEWFALKAGIDLTNAPSGAAAGVGKVPYPVRFVQVTLRITDNIEFREWKAWVGFTAAPLRQPLLGYAGFLQFFTATFHGDREEVELTVNATYRGT